MAAFYDPKQVEVINSAVEQLIFARTKKEVMNDDMKLKYFF